MTLIYQFMWECIFDPVIPISWGIYDIVITPNSLHFKVNGCKSQGIIEIVEENNLLILNLVDQRKNFSDPKDAFKWLDSQIE